MNAGDCLGKRESCEFSSKQLDNKSGLGQCAAGPNIDSSDYLRGANEVQNSRPKLDYGTGGTAFVGEAGLASTIPTLVLQ